jgi:hypothetical protein
VVRILDKLRVHAYPRHCISGSCEVGSDSLHNKGVGADEAEVEIAERRESATFQSPCLDPTDVTVGG